jgi:serine phosphatase RsbU (regulator of sigma subunit)
MAAQAESLIGGDLYAAVRTPTGTRLIIGDVMGKGLTAISDDLAAYLDHSVCWNLADPTA